MGHQETQSTSTSSLPTSLKGSQQELLEMMRVRAKNHLIDFMIATDSSYAPNWHHELLAKELENIAENGDRDYKFLIVTIPPRHGKSQLCSIGFPAWFLGKNTKKEIITVSYSAELAQDFGSKTREIVASDVFKYIFNTSLKEDDAAKARWRTDQGGSYTSVGVGGPVTGRGANVLLFDDPVRNREEAESETYRNKVWDFFTSTAFTRLEKGGVIVVVMTRWHVDDLAGRILANPALASRTKVIYFPAIALQDEEYRKEGEALWPEKYDVKSLNEIKETIGPYDWQSLYMGEPILTENQEIDSAWFKYISEVELLQKSTRNFLTIDTAMSKERTADYTGFIDNSVDSQNFWHIKGWHQKLSPEELVATIFNLYMIRRYEVIGIEKTAYLWGLKPYIDAEMRRRNTFLPILELSHEQKNKEIRIRGLIPRYASGSIFHVEGFSKELEEEERNFPRGLHDDILDALAYQLQVADAPNLAVGASAQIFLPVSDW